MSRRVLNVLLTHQPAPAVARMLAWWCPCAPPEDVLVVYTGGGGDFARVDHPNKIRVDDPRLRTRRHSRERQSYTGVVRAASAWLRERPAYTHVHFCEYDHLPLVPDLNARQLTRLDAERADVLCFELARVDGTSQPHFLYHTAMPGFTEFWRGLSVRRNPGVVLSMFGTGSFWTRAAFDAVAAWEEPFRIYLELYLPTLAHHLGFRLRDWGEQGRFISSLGEFAGRIEEARAAGMWTIHPVKALWNA